MVISFEGTYNMCLEFLKVRHPLEQNAALNEISRISLEEPSTFVYDGLLVLHLDTYDFQFEFYYVL